MLAARRQQRFRRRTRCAVLSKKWRGRPRSRVFRLAEARGMKSR